MVLVRADKRPSCPAEVVDELQNGAVFSEDHALYVGREHSTRVNCLIDQPQVSDRHARIECVPNEDGAQWTAQQPFWVLRGKPAPKYFVTDLCSGRGTYLNLVPLIPCLPAELCAGDVVAFGSANNAYRVVKATSRRGWFN